MNPVLLKPGSDRTSFVIVRGKPAGTLAAGEFSSGRESLARAAFTAYQELAERFDVVICEGAGSPAEINLRVGDYVNMGLARRFDLPVVIVGDIDRGGVFASLFGTVALLEPADRALVRGFVINKFRGDPAVLAPGLDELTRLTGLPVLGVVPWLPGVWLDGEDTLQVGRWRAELASSTAPRLSVAVIRFPRLSNVTDIDALASEPGITVSITDDPAVVRAADLIVLPGTRSTTSDLAWLRALGLAYEVESAAKQGVAVLGICGGYQMLGRSIDDPHGIEGHGAHPGLDLLPTAVTFAADKVLRLPVAQWHGERVQGYEIHHGLVEIDGSVEQFLDGCRVGSVWGTMWHGAFEQDNFRRTWLTEIARSRGSAWRPEAGATGFADRREQMIDTLADAVEAHLDIAALHALLGR